MPGAQRAFNPRTGYPASRAHLKQQGGLKDLLDFLCWRDVVFHIDDFDGDTINLDYYALANSGGTGAANFATNVQANGVVRGATGTTDNGSISAIGPLIYAGDNYAGMEARFKIDTVTSLAFEVGLIDAVPASNTGAVNDIDTPTSYGTDYAVVRMDTDETLTTSAFVTDGTAISATKTNLVDTTVPAAATYMTVRIQCMGPTNEVKCWVDGVLANPGTSTHQLEGGTLLAPWIWVASRATSTRLFDLDYLAVWADRV